MRATPAPGQMGKQPGPTAVAARQPAGPGFAVHLDVFDGPFDLLLSLIARHQLDVTEVALAKVTDDFIGYLRAAGRGWELGQASEFLVVAATLLDLKAARLLPSTEADDEEEDLALLEARDLLFARLLQYRAYKQASALLGALVALENRHVARSVSMERRFAAALPEISIGLSAGEFAEFAARALAPRELPVIAVDHLHVPQVSVREHAATLSARLCRSGSGSFRVLTSDCTSTLEVVARFLALLELYRDGAVTFEQVVPLGELQVRWAAHHDGRG